MQLNCCSSTELHHLTLSLLRACCVKSRNHIGWGCRLLTVSKALSLRLLMALPAVIFQQQKKIYKHLSFLHWKFKTQDCLDFPVNLCSVFFFMSTDDTHTQSRFIEQNSLAWPIADKAWVYFLSFNLATWMSKMCYSDITACTEMLKQQPR